MFEKKLQDTIVTLISRKKVLRMAHLTRQVLARGNFIGQSFVQSITKKTTKYINFKLGMPIFLIDSQVLC